MHACMHTANTHIHSHSHTHTHAHAHAHTYTHTRATRTCGPRVRRRRVGVGRRQRARRIAAGDVDHVARGGGRAAVAQADRHPLPCSAAHVRVRRGGFGGP